MSKVKPTTLQKRLAPIVIAMGYEFMGCELVHQGASATLRVYIDKEDGITVKDCARVSHQISAVLAVDDPVAGQYTLEISSPGIDRVLLEEAQYKKVVGQTVKIKLRLPADAQRSVTGKLVGVENGDIIILQDQDDVELKLPLSEIEKAKIVAAF